MVYVHFAEGFEEIEAVAIVDILRRGGVDAPMVSVSGNKVVRGSHDISVLTDLLFEEADYGKCDMIVLPGGGPGTANLLAHQGLAAEILSFAGEKKYLAAICAAPQIFGKLGILMGKKATIYPGLEEKLEGAQVSGDRVVADGNIITSRGVGTAIEFALALVKILKGAEKADELAEKMVVR